MSIDFGAVLLVCGGLLVGISLGGASTGAKEVANGVANGVVAKNTTTDEIVTNTETNIVTETEVYKIVCVAPEDGYCKEYAVRRITKE